jgi:hypothetical protein
MRNVATGDWVRVYPHDQPAQAGMGTVIIVSKNQRAITIGFEDPPLFIIGDHIALHPEHGILLFATRESEDRDAVWTEMPAGGRFVIEEP